MEGLDLTEFYEQKLEEKVNRCQKNNSIETAMVLMLENDNL